MSTLLDTNVLSELLRSAPEPMVLTWFAGQASETLFVSAITQAEMTHWLYEKVIRYQMNRSVTRVHASKW